MPDASRPADHYSYTHYASRETAEGFDALRFGGPIGRLLLETQERVLLDFLGDPAGQEVVDVGTGTGRAALSLASRRAQVTGLDASQEMLDVAIRRAAAAGLPITFRVGDAHALDAPDRAFDAAVSFRVLMHTPGWRQCIAELCRVSRHRVVIDYPARASAASLQAVTRRVAHALGRPAEAYRVFSHAAIREAFAAHGFAIARVHKQFVLPIALHKSINSRAWTERSEAWLDRLGLLARLGSPVTVLAERCDS